MKPDFFEMRYSVDVDNGAPWAQVLVATKIEGDFQCKECASRGIKLWRFYGEAHAKGLSGDRWADIIGAGSGPMAGPAFMVSDRVVEAMRASGVRDFEAFPVTISQVIGTKLKKSNRPDYFYLQIQPGLAVEYAAVTGQPDVCSTCGRMRGAFEVSKLHPRVETWSGADLFDGLNGTGPFCTEKVIRMAREFRWTNFEFNPIDILRESWRVPSTWNGINYLGKKWPPQWYPDRPSFGKSLDEWLEEYFQEGTARGKNDRIYAAGRALDDLGLEALPALVLRFKQGSIRAAHGIYSISQRGVTVPEDIFARAQQAVWDEDAKSNPHLYEQTSDGQWRPRQVT